MGYSDKDKILIKNLNDSKGYWEYSGKKLMSFLKNAGPKWTVMQRRVYQTQIHSVDELKWQRSRTVDF